MIRLLHQYRIKGKSKYFKEKYGTSNPIIEIEDTDERVFGKKWTMMDGNPACMLFGMRAGFEGVPVTGYNYYGHIKYGEARLGEVVNESELEEIPPSPR